MNYRIKVAILIGMIGVLCGCRGETKTLDEVLAIAKGGYDQVSLDGKVSKQHTVVTKVISDLESVVTANSSEDRKSFLPGIETGLAQLINHAGIPSRAALNELTAQYRGLSGVGTVESNQVKLLVARTYNILTTELKTTKFSY